MTNTNSIEQLIEDLHYIKPGDILCEASSIDGYSSYTDKENVAKTVFGIY